jgi:hypothetical protein
MASHIRGARRFGQLVVIALLGGTTSTVVAQGRADQPRVPTTFDQLSVVAAPGQKITVTDAQGQTFSGRIAGLSSSTLTLDVGRQVRELRGSDVVTLRQRRGDSLKNGALIGLATGGAVGMVTCGMCHVGPGLGAAAVYGGIGAGIGVGIDALIRGQVTIFQRPGAAGAKVSVVPQFARSHQSVAVSLKF